MKNRLIAANWKSNKTKSEAKNWFEEFSNTEIPQDLEVIIFAPFTLLDCLHSLALDKGLTIKLGAQNVSQFNTGPFTGEINAEQIKEFADYVLIGHSERRLNFNEDSYIIKKKVENSIAAGLSPIISISDFDQARELEFAREAIFMFEPASAISNISGGIPEDPNTVSRFSEKFVANFDNQLIYGGSISPDNVKAYLEISGISGVLVGAESLNAQSFADIIKNAG